MALTKQTLTLISIFVLLFSMLYAKETSSPTPNPSPKPAAASPSALSHLFNLLPSIGVKKAVVATPTKGAKVASKQLQAVEQKLVAFSVDIKYRLADPKTPQPTRKCLIKCDENFSAAIGDARTSIESIDKANITKAYFDINAVSRDIATCHDCFKETNVEDAEVKSFDEWVQGVIGDCYRNLQIV
ncbi:uncharacterized protein LOC112500046 [Cynara cardunculus var. scolymus]|uniref:uncharacterized protein LOC112500046 n=1 Tax=Cynara cardunculus var. scolymus TaxID=59895 RepID=UPI000D62C9E2|nr:uncharacterized protein LOC112500046 [Cynara cardunculus var. scolymus]